MPSWREGPHAIAARRRRRCRSPMYVLPWRRILPRDGHCAIGRVRSSRLASCALWRTIPQQVVAAADAHGSDGGRAISAQTSSNTHHGLEAPRAWKRLRRLTLRTETAAHSSGAHAATAAHRHDVHAIGADITVDINVWRPAASAPLPILPPALGAENSTGVVHGAVAAHTSRLRSGTICTHLSVDDRNVVAPAAQADSLARSIVGRCVRLNCLVHAWNPSLEADLVVSDPVRLLARSPRRMTDLDLALDAGLGVRLLVRVRPLAV
mmetsp:Transcript_97061/g.280115  ORF Transcript_97061/g.280115 Transcript_97061/m.280115 type:complete len:266 (+) Transcript_97061:252-1049(+)